MRGGRRGNAGRRTLLGLVLVVAMTLGAPSAVAEKVSIGHAVTVVGGVTETEFKNVRLCQSLPSSDGVDARVLDLGNTYSNTKFSVSGSSSAPFSLNVTFRNNGCFLVGSSLTRLNHLQQTSYTADPVPAGSRWAVVSLAYGADVTISWSVETP